MQDACTRKAAEAAAFVGAQCAMGRGPHNLVWWSLLGRADTTFVQASMAAMMADASRFGANVAEKLAWPVVLTDDQMTCLFPNGWDGEVAENGGEVMTRLLRWTHANKRVVVPHGEFIRIWNDLVIEVEARQAREATLRKQLIGELGEPETEGGLPTVKAPGFLVAAVFALRDAELLTEETVGRILVPMLRRPDDVIALIGGILGCAPTWGGLAMVGGRIVDAALTVTYDVTDQDLNRFLEAAERAGAAPREETRVPAEGETPQP